MMPHMGTKQTTKRVHELPAASAVLSGVRVGVLACLPFVCYLVDRETLGAPANDNNSAIANMKGDTCTSCIDSKHREQVEALL